MIFNGIKKARLILFLISNQQNRCHLYAANLFGFLHLQNEGNASNQYHYFTDCDEKYLVFTKE